MSVVLKNSYLTSLLPSYRYFTKLELVLAWNYNTNDNTSSYYSSMVLV